MIKEKHLHFYFNQEQRRTLKFWGKKEYKVKICINAFSKVILQENEFIIQLVGLNLLHIFFFFVTISNSDEYKVCIILAHSTIQSILSTFW